MHDRDLHDNILGISAPWQFSDVVLDIAVDTVEVFVEHDGEASCPKSAASRARVTTPWAEPDSRFTALLEAAVIDRPNEAAESMHARIQRIKRMACGSWSRERFRNAILSHLGRLDLYLRPVSTRTTS
jgi:hypothetical protein